MAKIFFCPHCGRKFDLLCEEDLIQYKNGVCSFCGFIGDFVDVGLSYDELFSQLDDYATQKINNQIAELNEQKSDLEIENARLTALETIKKSSVAAAMTKPVSTDYAQ